MHSYTLRLGHLPPTTKVRTVLTTDQCRIWPDYVNPPTNLTRASQNLGESTYWAPSLCTARTWAHPCLIYTHNPLANITHHYAQSREHPEASDTHIYVSPTSHDSLPYATYHITRGLSPTSHGVTQGLDHTQALCRAVLEALTSALAVPTPHIFIWLWPQALCDTILTLKPYRDIITTDSIRALLDTFFFFLKSIFVRLGVQNPM